MLARALQMSVEGGGMEVTPPAADVTSPGETPKPAAAADDDLTMMTEEEQIAYALRLSMQAPAGNLTSSTMFRQQTKLAYVHCIVWYLLLFKRLMLFQVIYPD